MKASSQCRLRARWAGTHDSWGPKLKDQEISPVGGLGPQRIALPRAYNAVKDGSATWQPSLFLTNFLTVPVIKVSVNASPWHVQAFIPSRLNYGWFFYLCWTPTDPDGVATVGAPHGYSTGLLKLRESRIICRRYHTGFLSPSAYLLGAQPWSGGVLPVESSAAPFFPIVGTPTPLLGDLVISFTHVATMQRQVFSIISLSALEWAPLGDAPSSQGSAWPGHNSGLTSSRDAI